LRPCPWASGQQVSSSDFRTSGERFALFVGIVFLSVLLLCISCATCGYGLLFMLLGVIIAKLTQAGHRSRGIRVTETSEPRLWRLAQIAAGNLGMLAPEVYCIYSQELNAFAMGVLGRKSVFVHTKLLEVMDDSELCFVLGHEFAHIKCNHVFFLIFNIPTVMLRSGLQFFLDLIFRKHSRLAEHTADRGGLIACRCLNAAVRALLKLRVPYQLVDGQDMGSLIESVRKDDLGMLRKLVNLAETHPLAATRIQHLVCYHDSPKYQTLFACRVNGRL